MCFARKHAIHMKAIFQNDKHNKHTQYINLNFMSSNSEGRGGVFLSWKPIEATLIPVYLWKIQPQTDCNASFSSLSESHSYHTFILYIFSSVFILFPPIIHCFLPIYLRVPFLPFLRCLPMNSDVVFSFCQYSFYASESFIFPCTKRQNAIHSGISKKKFIM